MCDYTHSLTQYKKAKELHSSGSDLKDVVECARVAKATFEAAIEHMLAFLGDSEVTDMRYKALVQEVLRFGGTQTALFPAIRCRS